MYSYYICGPCVVRMCRNIIVIMINTVSTITSYNYVRIIVCKEQMLTSLSSLFYFYLCLASFFTASLYMDCLKYSSEITADFTYSEQLGS